MDQDSGKTTKPARNKVKNNKRAELRLLREIRAGEAVRVLAVMLARKFLLEQEYRDRQNRRRTGLIIATRAD